jgi:hypothetical protein
MEVINTQLCHDDLVLPKKFMYSGEPTCEDYEDAIIELNGREKYEKTMMFKCRDQMFAILAAKGGFKRRPKEDKRITIEELTGKQAEN